MSGSLAIKSSTVICFRNVLPKVKIYILRARQSHVLVGKPLWFFPYDSNLLSVLQLVALHTRRHGAGRDGSLDEVEEEARRLTGPQGLN